jgi:hypothetical protein
VRELSGTVGPAAPAEDHDLIPALGLRQARNPRSIAGR